MLSRPLTLIAAFLGLVVLAGVLTLFFIDESLREYLESSVNTRLQGYSVELERVDFHPLGLSIDFENLVLRQEANPGTPMVTIPSWTASVEWTELLRLRFVSDHVIENANIILNVGQAQQEDSDRTPVNERGWQEAVFTMYPVTINSIRFMNGSFSFQNQTDIPPLQVTEITCHAENIQNIRSGEGEFPSKISFNGQVSESGALHFDGHVNFLAEPFPGVSAKFEATAIPLEPFLPLSSLANVEIQSGSLSARGEMEYSPWKQFVHIEFLELVGPRIDYVAKKSVNDSTLTSNPPSQGTSGKQERDGRETFQITVASAHVTQGEIGFRNEQVQPSYRIFFSNLDGQMSGMGAPAMLRSGHLRIAGKFMEVGNSEVEGVFHSEVEHLDFTIKIQIAKTDMTRFNDVFRAHGGFDIRKGTFSLFSEISAHDGQVKGYMKPFFEKPEIYNFSQDQTDNMFQQMYEAIVGGVASLLENMPRDQVATKSEISGNLDDLNMNTWELIGNLLRNAFVDALIPSFDRLKKIGEA
ncbi:MAG: DUF748 domain-containing protein [Nitrospirales bacterium]